MPPDSQLPESLSGIVAGTSPDESDEISALRETLDATQSALDDAQSQLKELRASVKILSDNNEIKQSAVKYAKRFMIAIPCICLFILALSVFDGFSVTIGEKSYAASWSMAIEDYGQAALVVTTVVFVATVLGFLLKGVFGQSASDDDGGLKEILTSVKGN